MRFLGIGEYHSLGDMYWRLTQAGHQVRVFVEEDEAHELFSGMVERIADWRSELPWIKEVGKDGVIIFESAAKGELQDQLRNAGYQVIGGSAFGDQLESDRVFGQEVLREAGLQTAPVHRFENYHTASTFLRQHPGRYVYKNNGNSSPSTRNFIGELDDGADMLAFLSMQENRSADEAQDFVLMQHLQGIEIGVGAYFNGEAFLSPACLDWEHKRFFPGDLGELTGEMGTLVTYRGAEKIFNLTLAKLTDRLRAGHYCGYINLNTIINEQGIWPLEFTCRFGYPGFAICDALHAEGWDSVFRKMLGHTELNIATRDGYAIGVVLTVPPFPYEFGYAELSRGLPISFSTYMTESERERLHFGEVALVNGQLVTSGSIGYVLVATGTGSTVAEAQQAAYALIGKIAIPNMRYRNDIGERFLQQDHSRLQALGYLDE